MNLSSPGQIKTNYPLSVTNREFILEKRKLIRDLIIQNDPRWAIVLGPCSVHDRASALEYASRLKRLSDECIEFCVCVMRVYIEKPRTVGGWKGFINDPHLDESNDIQAGILQSRQLMLDITALGIPIAVEIVNPLFLPYFEDLICWGFIGARTSASPLHREIASWVPFPIGFKNSLNGSIEQAVHGMVVAGGVHRFPYLNDRGCLTLMESEGNLYTHVVLRGSSIQPNYDPDSFQILAALMQRYHLHRRFLVDCAHGNSQGEYKNQRKVFRNISEQFGWGDGSVLGVMLESNLEEGSQSLLKGDELKYGVSVTDSCVGWSETEELVRECAHRLSLSKWMSSTNR